MCPGKDKQVGIIGVQVLCVYKGGNRLGQGEAGEEQWDKKLNPD